MEQTEVLKTRDPWGTLLVWETVPINKNICSKLWLNHFVDYERKKTLTPFENWIVLVRLKLNLIQARMSFVKFGWNWPSGSGEEDKNVNSLQTDGHTDGRQAIRKAFIQGKLKRRFRYVSKISFWIYCCTNDGVGRSLMVYVTRLQNNESVYEYPF